MLLTLLGYYAFHVDNENIHSWIRERMLLLSAKNYRPFLTETRMILKHM